MRLPLPPDPHPNDIDDAERRRLARLRLLGVLDSAPEPAFDALVRVAAAVCGTPIALISLVDEDRQWFKANLGLEGTAQTPREVAFCAHAIRDDQVMQVPDARQDPRFAANPLVLSDPHIRFYAGAPIEMPGGERIGTVCVIDRAPARLDAGQAAALRDLALVARTLLLQRERLYDLTVLGDETRFQAVSFASPLGIFQADQGGALFDANGRWQSLFGMDRDQALGLGWQRAIAPQDRAQVGRRWADATAAAAGFDSEFRVQRPDGSTLDVHMQARPARWGEPPRSGFVGVVGDITARKDAQRRLEEANTLLSEIVESLPCGLSVFDRDLRLVLHNRLYRELLGFPDVLFDSAHGRFEDFIRYNAERGEYGPGDIEAQVRAIVERARQNQPHAFQRERPDGTALDIRGAPLPGGGWVSTYMDITAARRAKAEVQAARDAAEAANRAKTDFLDTVSHEIRTPLNGVLGMTRLLLREALDPVQRHYVELADAAASSLLALINDLLDLSKVEAGRVELESIAFPLHVLLRQLQALHEPRAREKQVALRLEVDAGVPAGVRGDPARLRQVLNNLLSNALKFTDSGEVVLAVRPDQGMLAFSVRDSGIGIAPEAQARLFTRFAQAEQSTARRYGGTGLGLAIVKDLVELMGGTLALDSAPGQGSTFTCRLPLPADDAGARAPESEVAPPPGAVRAVRLLVAEDNPTNQVVVRGLLAQAGYRDLTLVEDGAQAVEAACSQAFDLVLMDCRMPVLDGYQATAQLRDRGCTVPVIALTANASEAERQRCLAAGMDDYLTKPLDGRLLAEALARWTQVRATPPAAEPAAAEPAGYSRADSLDQLGGDAELLTMALASFRAHAPGLLQSLREALEAGDGTAAHRHLHSLAGASSMVAARPLAARARALEAEAEGGALARPEERLRELAALLDAFLAASADW